MVISIIIRKIILCTQSDTVFFTSENILFYIQYKVCFNFLEKLFCLRMCHYNIAKRELIKK